MANVVLTEMCNLNCKYCFAPKEGKIITRENFIRALALLDESNIRSVNLIGGEPLLHPEIREYIELAFTRGFENVLLFSNGLLLDKIQDLLVKYSKLYVLINVNAPEDISMTNYNKIVKTLSSLENNNLLNQVYLGVNIYKRNQNIDFVVDLMKRYKKEFIRIAVAIPPKIEKSSFDYFDEMRTTVFRVIKMLVMTGITPKYDCNAIPLCFWNDNERRQLLELKQRFPFQCRHIWLEQVKCTPVIDILPDLSVVRCFGMKSLMNIEINDGDNINDVKEVFGKCIDEPIMRNSKCQINGECPYYGSVCYGGCLAFPKM